MKLNYINSGFEFVNSKDVNEEAELNLDHITYNSDSGSSDEEDIIYLINYLKSLIFISKQLKLIFIKRI